MKKFITGLMVGAIIATSVSVFGEEVTKQVNAVYGRVKVVIEEQPMDKETILIDGTTYVPLRAAGDMLGYEVSYDPETYTAYLDEIGTNRFGTGGGEVTTDPQTPVTPEATYNSLEELFAKNPEEVTYWGEVEDYFNELFEGNPELYVDVEGNDLYISFVLEGYVYDEAASIPEQIMATFLEEMEVSLVDIASNYQQYVTGGEKIMVNLEVLDEDGEYIAVKSDSAPEN